MNGKFTVYEADTNPHAKTGEDLLDIRDKVTVIDVLSEEDETTVLATIDGEGPIDYLVGLVLESPVDQESRDLDGPHYFLGFRLADGTSVVRSFWLESGDLSRGIITDPAVTLQVWLALPEEHRPAATDDGPKISERWALRLGLAYLSSSAPELEVTGRPHSPVARLMRLSEFDALISSVSARPTDPLVWVAKPRVLGAAHASYPRKRDSTGRSAWWCLMPIPGHHMPDATETRRYGERPVTPPLLHRVRHRILHQLRLGLRLGLRLQH